MGTFAEIENVDYHLLFADQGKQTSVFHIYIFTICIDENIFQQKCPSIYIYIERQHIYRDIYILKRQHIYRYVYIYLYLHINIHTVSNGKQKTEAQAPLIHLPFAHRANGTLFFVC